MKLLKHNGEERLKQTEAPKLKITASETEIEDALKRFSSRAKLSADVYCRTE